MPLWLGMDDLRRQTEMVGVSCARPDELTWQQFANVIVVVIFLKETVCQCQDDLLVPSHSILQKTPLRAHLSSKVCYHVVHDVRYCIGRFKSFEIS
jgi:hypothetical protein